MIDGDHELQYSQYQAIHHVNCMFISLKAVSSNFNINKIEIQNSEAARRK